ncbi:hypothetical protein CW304_11750 [Bacillus sp. UFRGS-B20]|nr:hypothetical protein CW304_11750 [Bacillus sp. UFRGS-B20]
MVLSYGQFFLNGSIWRKIPVDFNCHFLLHFLCITFNLIFIFLVLLSLNCYSNCFLLLLIRDTHFPITTD